MVLLIATSLVLLWTCWVMIETVWGVYDMHYTLTESALEITYGPTHVQIPRQEILSVNQVAVSQKRGSRVYGTGMPGLQEGHWRFPETGDIRLYSTDLDLLTVVETADRKWGISPADPTGFTAALAAGETGRWEPAATRAGPFAIGLALFVLIISGGAVGLIVWLVKAAGSVIYMLDDRELSVQIGRFKAQIPYEKIRSVELAKPGGRLMKVAGTAIPGLYWGTFVYRTEKLRIKLYSTDYHELVLIRTGKETYGVSPADKEGFMAAVRRRSHLS